MPTLYSILDRDTRAWWYHQKLRAMGQADEARQRERQSIKRWAAQFRETMRNRGYLSIGRGGNTLHVSAHTTVSGFSWAIAEAAKEIGVIVIDTTIIPLPAVAKLAISGPMAAIAPEQPDPEPWNSLSRIPLDRWLANYHAAGALIWNWEPTTIIGGAHVR